MPDAYQPVRIPKGKRPQKNSIYYAENCGVGADAQAESDYRDGRKPGRLSQLPHRVSEILYKSRHFISRTSLVPQCHHGIHLGRPPRRNVASEHDRKKQHSSGQQQRHRIQETNLIKQAGKHAAKHQRGDKA